MAKETTNSESTSTTETNPNYTPEQQSLIDMVMNALTGGDSGTYQAMMAISQDPKKVTQYIIDNPDKVKDAELAKILNSQSEYYSGSGMFGAVEKLKDYNKNVRTNVQDYLTKNPEAAMQMDIGKEGSDWANQGGKVYTASDIENSPLFKAFGESQQYKSGALKDYGGILQGASNDLVSGLETEKARSIGRVSDINKARQQTAAETTSEFTNAINQLLAENKISISEAKSMLKPVSFGYGGGNISVTPKRNITLSQTMADLANNAYNTGSSGAKDIYGSKQTLGDKIQNDSIGAESYTHGLNLENMNAKYASEQDRADRFIEWASNADPNKPLYAIMDIMMPQSNFQQQFGLSTGTTTGSGTVNSTTTTPDASLVSQLGSLAGSVGVGATGASNLMNAITNWGGF